MSRGIILYNINHLSIFKDKHHKRKMSMSTNYMSYSNGGTYDEDIYSGYATATYGGTERTFTKEDQSAPAQPTEMKKPSFEVIGANQPQTQPPEKTAIQTYYTCPVCGNTASRACGCEYRDASCSRGHSVKVFKAGKRELGVSPNHLPNGPCYVVPVWINHHLGKLILLTLDQSELFYNE